MAITALRAVILIIGVLAISGAFAQSKFPSLHPDAVIAKYGKPDAVESTEYDDPRPPFVTRMLTYRKERVRCVFLPDEPVGSPPPYKKWLFLGAQDARDNSVLKAEEVTARMKHRAKK